MATDLISKYTNITADIAAMMKKLEQIGIDSLNVNYHIRPIAVRRFERGTQGGHSIEAVYVGPVAKLTTPTLAYSGSYTGRVLVSETIEVILVGGRLWQVDSRDVERDGESYILVGSDINIVSQLDILLSRRDAVARTLAKIDEEITEAKKNY